MLQSDRRTAVNEIIKTAKKIKNIYRNASEEDLDQEISTLCRAISREHEKVIGVLENEILMLGDLPPEPDPDKQILEEGLTHIKAQLSRNTEFTLLEELQGYEKQLAERVAEANELNLADSMSNAIDSLKQVISRSFMRLSEAKLRQI